VLLEGRTSWQGRHAKIQAMKKLTEVKVVRKAQRRSGYWWRVGARDAMISSTAAAGGSCGRTEQGICKDMTPAESLERKSHIRREGVSQRVS
jgi:hypothetical protein